ncbi:MAG TPA: cobyrinate a,c-diamide synthase [Chloroflexota bacterium]|nr:cobyrinate a,c-diamide synthase [Chloroflexota bacterium]
MARVVIAGVASGVGKTTLAAGIVAALRRRGLRVQPFKVGPDYIDPSYLGRAAGAPARNLDGWLVPPNALRTLFARAAAAADVAVIEGVMGLYDGRADTGEGSTAELARLLGAPVVVVVDVGKMSRTAAAVVLGCQRFEPDVRLGGVLLNRVGSTRHLAWTSGPIAAATGLPTLGHMPKRAELALPERYLGLVPTAEGSVDDGFFERLADQVEATVDLDGLVALARAAPPLARGGGGELFPRTPRAARVRIAVARDAAFNFYYEDNLDLLRAWGAELVPFSPLADAALPPGVGGVYIGGGFPELYARELAANEAARADLRRAADAGVVVYGECGGLMYLSEGIVDRDAARHPMVGLIPGWSTLERGRLTVGYRTATARRDSFLLRAGERVRAHEFHWSGLVGGPPPDAAYQLDETGAVEGYARGNVLASYLHVHFGSDPRLAPRFVEACAVRRPLEVS